MIELKDIDILWLAEEHNRALYEQNGNIVRGTVDHGNFEDLLISNNDLPEFSNDDDLLSYVKDFITKGERGLL